MTMSMSRKTQAAILRCLSVLFGVTLWASGPQQAYSAPGNFLCRKDLGNGYKPKYGVWESFTFLSFSEGYLIRKLSQNEQVESSQWGVFSLPAENRKRPTYYCKLEENTMLVCPWPRGPAEALYV
jgi:hypothetical protein